jgi:yopX protein
MRNIKYKLYSPSWNKVFRVTNIAFNKQGLIETVAVPMKDALPEYYGDTNLVLDLYPKDKIELLEFTGKYDVNGKKIYEGYIVETPTGARAKVYFDEQDLMYKVEIPSTEIFSLAENIPLKVIGNIYENEDLLYKEI